MSQNEKGPSPKGDSPVKIASAKKHNDYTTKPKKLGKLDGMLRRFAQGARLHRFQAERVGDHCLHSTVSGLQIKHGIYFHREMVKVPNRFGSLTPVCKYWLEGDSLEKARRICGLDLEVAA